MQEPKTSFKLMRKMTRSLRAIVGGCSVPRARVAILLPHRASAAWPQIVAPAHPRNRHLSDQNCSDCFVRRTQPVNARGSHERIANMDQFIRTQNVARYRRLLERVTEESGRQTIFNLLAEEQQKQKDAGDPI
jgi:hypothetical protein